MRRLGADREAFETIVASGERSALPHAQPTSRPIQLNQLLLIDMGATVAGYASDMTRTLAVGKPTAEARRMYRAVLEGQLRRSTPLGRAFLALASIALLATSCAITV